MDDIGQFRKLAADKRKIADKIRALAATYDNWSSVDEANWKLLNSRYDALKVLTDKICENCDRERRAQKLLDTHRRLP